MTIKTTRGPRGSFSGTVPSRRDKSTATLIIGLRLRPWYWCISRTWDVEPCQTIEKMFSEVTIILHLGPIRGCMSSINFNTKEEAFARCTRRSVGFVSGLKESLKTRQCPLYISLKNHCFPTYILFDFLVFSRKPQQSFSFSLTRRSRKII